MRKKSTDKKAYTESRTFAVSMVATWSGKCVFAFEDGVMPAVPPPNNRRNEESARIVAPLK